MKKVMLVVLALLCAAASSYAQNISPEELARRTLERRAIEAMNWGMSAVNTDLMLQEMLTKTAGKVNQIIYWSRPLDWHNQTLTPNPDAIYVMAFFNTVSAPQPVSFNYGALDPPWVNGTTRFVDGWNAGLGIIF